MGSYLNGLKQDALAVGEFLKRLIEENRFIRRLEAMPERKRIVFLFGVMLPLLIGIGLGGRYLLFGPESFSGGETIALTWQLKAFLICLAFVSLFAPLIAMAAMRRQQKRKEKE